MIFYADDAVLIYFATTPLELKKILQRDFSFISDWYTYNRLTLHVKKTKIMFVGSKTMLLKFEDFDFSLGGGGRKLIVFLLLNTSALSWTKNGIGNYILAAYRGNLAIGCHC